MAVARLKGGLSCLKAATILATWQSYLIKDRDPALCFEAFLNNNWLGIVLFAGFVLDYQFKGIT
jgi:4-hydroxybenzoate polyprenyltransferase